MNAERVAAVKKACRIPPYEVSRRSLEVERYVEEMPAESVDRMVQAQVEFWPCCWEPRSGEHHPVCRKGS